MSLAGSILQRERLNAIDVDAHLRRAIGELHNAERSVFLWFCEIERRCLYRDLGYGSLHAYASEKLGLSANRINRYIRLMEDLRELPRIRTALLRGRLGWTKVRVIVRVASPMNEGAWLKAALQMSRRELEAKILESRNVRRRDGRQPELMACQPSKKPPKDASQGRASKVFRSPDPALSDEGKTSVTFRLSATELARYEALIEKLHKLGRIRPGTPRQEILLMALSALADASATVPRGTVATKTHIHIRKDSGSGAAFCQTQRGPKKLSRAELEAAQCDAVINEPGKPNRSTIRPSVKEAVLTRDNHQCRAPGCSNTHFLEIHHIVARQKGGANDPKNLVTVCSGCHRLIHEGKIHVAQIE